MFDSSIGRDVDDLTDVEACAIAAHDKVDKIKAMMEETQYSATESQERLKQWLETAEKRKPPMQTTICKLILRNY